MLCNVALAGLIDAGNEFGTLARLMLQRAQSQWQELDAHLACGDERIAAAAQANEAVNAAATLLGVGPVTASALIAPVGDFEQFKCGAQFGAWIGLTPHQHSSEGKNNSGGITQRGDTYMRPLLVRGAKSAVVTAHLRADKISQWAFDLFIGAHAAGAKLGVLIRDPAGYAGDFPRLAIMGSSRRRPIFERS